MNSGSSRHSGRLGAALLATVFAVLFGFFAMHGLAAHGVGHEDGSHSTIPGVAETVDDHAAAGGLERGTIRSAVSGAVAEHAPSSPAGPVDVTGEACLVILGLLVGLLVLALRNGRAVRPMFILRRMRLRLILYARPAEPPCLHRLSILRC